MPWESRIANESLRRVVLAGLMMGLLAGSTGLAMLLTHQRNPRYAASWQREDFGPLHVKRPSHWQMAAEGGADGLVAILTDPSPDQRRITVSLIQLDQPVDPTAVIDEVFAQNMGTQFNRGQTFRAGAVVGHHAEGFAYLKQGRVRMLASQVILDATLDGRTHLLLHLRRRGLPHGQDVALLIAMAQSLSDQRVEPVRDAIELGEATVNVPEHLVAWRPADESLTGRYDLTPDGAGPWKGSRFIRLSPRRLDLAELSNEALAEIEARDLPPPESQAMREALEELDDPDDLTQALLMTMRRGLHPREDPRPHYGTGTLDGKVVHTMVMDDGRRSPLFHAVWVVRGPRDVVVRMDVLSARVEINAALQAARRVVEQLHWVTDSQTDQETES